ncbi:MAG: Spy/CpxP family protein refolding chaperone [Chloroflexi bacterium]|nr:Spy/CpxP family protein refolding chaperone [Chloroflexota bacterium]
MSKKNILITAVMFVVACIVSWGIVFSQPQVGAPAAAPGAKGMKAGQGMKGGHAGKHGKMRCLMIVGHININNLDRFVDLVKATPEQETKLKDAVIANEKQKIELSSQTRMKMLELSAALYGDNIDVNKARALIKEMGEIRTKEQLGSLDQYIKFKEILTPDQFKKIEAPKMMQKPPKGMLQGGKQTAEEPLPGDLPENLLPPPLPEPPQ